MLLDAYGKERFLTNTLHESLVVNHTSGFPQCVHSYDWHSVSRDPGITAVEFLLEISGLRSLTLLGWAAPATSRSGVCLTSQCWTAARTAGKKQCLTPLLAACDSNLWCLITAAHCGLWGPRESDWWAESSGDTCHAPWSLNVSVRISYKQGHYFTYLQYT